MEEFLQVGAIANTHGIAGEVKVFPMTDDIKRFKKLKEVYLDTGKERKLLHVVSCKFVKNQPVLKFKEFTNINEVEMYKRKGLFVTRDQAVPLGKDEYFIADLIYFLDTFSDRRKQNFFPIFHFHFIDIICTRL